MNVVTKIIAGCDAKDSFPPIYEDLPGVNEVVYSNEGNPFRVVKILREPKAGVMIPVLVVEQQKTGDKTLICG